MSNKEKKKMKPGTKGLVIWGSVGGFLIVLFIVVNILATSTFYSLLNLVMPGGGLRPVFAEGVESYYLSDYTSKSEVFEAAKNFNVTLGEEGYVLLKNDNGALPIRTEESEDDSASSAPKVSVFGKNSVDLAYGGSGSSSISSTDCVDLYEALEEAGYECNPTLKSFYEDTSLSGDVRDESGDDLDSGDTVVLSTAETPQSSYTDSVKSSYSDYSDAAIVVFTRVGGEGMDLPRIMTGATGYRNEDDHFLQLDANEEDLLVAVCEAGFDKVVVVINSANAMELGFLEEDSPYVTEKGYEIDPSKIDAAIWMGYPGISAATALGSIMNGNVNPSGHTVDTYVTDLKDDPTWYNFGDNRVSGGDQYTLNGTSKLYYFVDYEEDIYDGYRYYETRYADDEDGYDDAVVYPFGYGLSYTTFEWELEDASGIENVAMAKDGTYTVDVKVTNTGDVAGKDVVQLYGHAPYTEGGIEKSEEVLLAFAKTDTIQPGKSDTVTLEINPYYMASYDCYDANGNGFCGYELEAGDYELYVSENAHDRVFTISCSVASGIQYDTDPTTDYEVQNLYTDCDDSYFDSDTQLSTRLSRADWEGTWPTTPDEDERAKDSAFFTAMDDTSDNNDDVDGVEMPYFGESGDMVLRDMLFDEDGEILDEDGDGIPFVEYDDERWDELLDQGDLDEMLDMYNNAAYSIVQVESIGLPAVKCADGPVGFTCFMDSSSYQDTCNYVCEPVVAATWNLELVTEYGEMLGNEGIIGDEGNTDMPYTCIYAPGANIHRSAFGGRNAEYYSEDGLLTGKMAAAEISGMQSKGVVPFIKHFALNEQETHRSVSGDVSWVSEQAMREIYLKGFEIAVKEGGCRGVMTSFNRIGTRWTGGDYRLVTEILRNEWGFKGAVICDFNTIPKYMNPRQMAYAGGDLDLCTTASARWTDFDSGSNEDVYILRQCVKNVAYALVNSNAMNGEITGYDMPYWQIVLYVVDVVVAVGIVVWGGFAVFGFVKGRKKQQDE